MPRDARILVIGYGNRTRADDGVGLAVADAITALGLDGVNVQTRHQLQIEDAVEVAKHDVVIFVDADVACDAPFTFRAIGRDGDPSIPGSARAEPSLLTHDVAPDEVLGLAAELFDADVRGYALGIRGYRFEMFDESISDDARVNMTAACSMLARVLRCGSLDAFPAPALAPGVQALSH